MIEIDITEQIISKIDKDQLKKLCSFIDAEIWGGGTILTAGNGGSASNASHLTADLMRRGISSICLSDNIAHLTAVANDEDYDEIFVKTLQVYRYMQQPVIVLFTVSGESSNLKALVRKAKAMGIKVVSFVGGSKTSSIAKDSYITVSVPTFDYGVVESLHLLMAHSLAQYLKRI